MTTPTFSRRSAFGLAAAALALTVGSALVPAANAAPSPSPSATASPSASAAPSAPSAPVEKQALRIVVPTGPKAPAALVGTGKPGLPVSVTVTDGNRRTSARGVIDANGRVRLSIPAPAGGWRAGVTYIWGADISAAAAGGGEFTMPRTAGSAPTKSGSKSGANGGLAKTGV